MAQSFPNWMTTIKPQIQEAQWNPVSRNMNKTQIPRYVIIKLLKYSDEEKTF